MNENNYFADSTSYNAEPTLETTSVEPEVVVIPEPVTIIAEPIVEAPIFVAEPVVEPTPVVETPVVVEEPVVAPIVEPVAEPVKLNTADVSDKVALYSSANLFKYKLGELKVGYNIVSKEDSVLWLKSKKVRVATPEEVAQYYNK
jgi:hypothetical protein